MLITDKDRIDFLQHIMVTNGCYTKKCILQKSQNGGYQLNETAIASAGNDIRTEIDKVINNYEATNSTDIPLPPTPPPSRIFKEHLFSGFVETKESKEATRNWYLNNGVNNNQNTINDDETTRAYKKRNKIEQFLEKFFDAIFGI